ncbi:MAG TPA: 3-oxoacyl-ACP reductase FabG [Nitrososphaerales archaeon]|nr:3-oxoacyl-ACP reductase FabG [Nitrososphaerales archaeon]
MKSLELFDLSGKAALVTGGGRGIGKTIALALAEAGADVAVASRDEQACAATAKDIAVATGRTTLSGKLDVTEKGSVVEFAQMAREKLGKIDILVNNSGATWGAPFEEMPLERWDRVIKVNLTGTFLMCQSVVPIMRRQKWGRIVNIASVAGLYGAPSFMHASGYSASKGGIIALTKELAVKLAEYCITVNAIAPSFFQTKMSQPLTDRFGELIRKDNPMKRMGEDDDLKGVAVFLASEASRYVTGQVIPLDGGQTAA